MNFWEKTKQLSDAVSEAKHQIEANIDKAIATTRQTTEMIAATSTEALQQAQQSVEETVEQSTRALGDALGSAKDAGEAVQQSAQELTASSWNKLQELQGAAHEQSRQSLQSMSKALEDWQATVAGLGTSGMVTANALKDLPRTAQALAEEMPKLAQRLKTAGTRIGDASRSDADIMGLFDKIPGTSKLGANERDIRVFLSDKHGSHIHPHSRGGSNGADNIVWEVGADNIRRGAEVMTGGEQLYIRFYNAVDSILKNSTTIAKLGVTATGTAVLTQAAITALSYTLDLYRGDITVEEFRDKVVEAAISAGIATPIFFLIFIAAIALIPEIVVVLSAPAVVVGFNALFGIGIALPIVQSIIRHVEAGGFGDEVKAQYEATIAQGEALMQESSQEVQKWWQQFFADAPSLGSNSAAQAI